jgi:CRISPR-associated protein Csm2
MSTGSYREGVPPRTPASLAKEDCQRIIVEGDTETLVKRAEAIGATLAGQLTTAQIRNVFGTVRKIEMLWRAQATPAEQRQAVRQLLLLKPKLAYQAKRQRGRGVEELQRVLVPAIDMIQDKRDRFQNFMDFFEAIVAYHLAAGPQ